MIYKSIYLAKRNPSVAPEDWPRTWRSHPKAVAQLGSVGGDIAAAIDTINYCARIRDPVLDGAPFESPELSQEHDGVAVVSGRSEQLHQISGNRDGQEAVIADELRVFGRPADKFTMLCREVVSLGGKPGQAAIIRFLARKPGTTPDAFLKQWTGDHAELASGAVSTGKLVRWVQNQVVLTPPPGYEFDGISEAWFDSVEDAVRSLADPGLVQLKEDLGSFCDTARTVTMLTEVIYRLPRE